MRLMVSAQPSDRPLSAAIADNARIAQSLVEPAMRHAMITEAAYFRALRRGFAPGHELDDWLAAEIEINELLVNALLK